MNQVTAVEFSRLAKLIEANRNNFLEALCYISTYRAANYEIDHAIQTLAGAEKELNELSPNSIEQLATYLPSNVILFSYILYAVIPSAFCNHIYVRPSIRGREVAWTINNLVNNLLPLPITLEMYMSRRQFWETAGSKSRIIAFTGKCRNSFEISADTAENQLFIYFGSGVNPMIIGNKVDLKKTIKDIIYARTFNSGQDCLCPDLILVHKDIINNLIDKLIFGLSRLKHGNLNSHTADYSNLVYPNIAEYCYEFFKQNKENIVYGGETDILTRHVQPTIILRKISDLKSYSDYPEFFAPVFNIAVYQSLEEIKALISGSDYSDHAMGVMLYGTESLKKTFRETHMMTIDQTLFEINYGNRPFGGSGICASYVKFNGKTYPQPVLISRETKRYLMDG